MLVRPNQFKNCKKTDTYDLELKIVDCTFNGKCFEVLAQTKNCHHLIIFETIPQEIGAQSYYILVYFCNYIKNN